MFGKKKKLDSKIRFQHMGFKKRLQLARGYKRPIKKIPETAWERFLSVLRLDSALAQIVVVLAILLAAYLIYVPNFFYLKTLEIQGLEGEPKTAVEKDLQAFFKVHLFWPQKNLLLLSRGKLSSYLQTQTPDVAKVDLVQKDYPNTLIIKITQRVQRYLLTAEGGDYVVSNDGLIMGELANSSAGSSSGLSLINISIQNLPQTEAGQKILSPQLISAIDFYNENLNKQPGFEPANFELNGPEEPDLTVNMKAGPKLVFDIKSDLNQTFSRLKLLLAQIGSVDQNKLYYVDMRISNRGYVCYTNTACANPDFLISTSTASSTLEKITN